MLSIQIETEDYYDLREQATNAALSYQLTIIVSPDDGGDPRVLVTDAQLHAQRRGEARIGDGDPVTWAGEDLFLLMQQIEPAYHPALRGAIEQACQSNQTVAVTVATVAP